MTGKSKLPASAIIMVPVLVLNFTSCKLGGPFEPSSYVIVYDANGGSGATENSTHIYGASKNLNANAFTRAGYAFIGWALSPSGTVQYENGQNVKNLTKEDGAAVTLFAVWAYIVIYDANGGAGTMENTIIIPGKEQKLRTNAFTNGDLVFIGWAISPTGTVLYPDEHNLSEMATADDGTATLYAVWHYTVVPGENLAAKLTWLQINALSNIDYTLELSAAELIGPRSLSYNGRENISINLTSTGGVRIIGLSSNGSLFTVDNGVTLTLDNNIALHGRDNNNAALVQVNSGGTLLMNAGSRITENTLSDGGGVEVSGGGTFIMNGGEISNNRSYSNSGGVDVSGDGTFTMNGGKIYGNTTSISTGGGGVGVHNTGTFTMNGGEISNNRSYSSNGAVGGGVHISSGTFTMNGGVISGNSAEDFGGGVELRDNGTFTMSGGIISANSADAGGGINISSGAFRISGGTIYGLNAAADLRNTAFMNLGSALYVYSGTAQHGTFSGGVWNSLGNLARDHNNTVQVTNGVLQ